ncbi:MAG: hypothetical protein GY757_11820 [bacterium]|nr:hypothetical protein [bacterium]
MKNKFSLYFLLIFLLTLTTNSLFSLTLNVRSFDHTGYTRVVFEGDRGFEFNYKQNKELLTINLKEQARLEGNTRFSNSRLINKVVHRVENNKSVLDVHLKSNFKVKKNFVLERPFRLVFDVVEAPKVVDTEPVPLPIEEKNQDATIPRAEPSSIPTPPDSEEVIPQQAPPSITPTPRKKWASIETICIDPGHGGNDLGAVGSLKVPEKKITLKVSNKLKQLIISKLGLRVIMTRKNDTEVSLNSRIAIANNQKAQIFVSIHVNSSFRKAARGPETFYVSLKATDQEAFKLSQIENQSSDEFEQIASDDELKMILWDMAQNEHIKESSKLAEFVQNELNILLHTTNRGVKQAPFRVLMRAAMPAILVEIAFISNPFEEKKLLNNVFIDKVAAAIYSGISKFIYYHNTMYR